MHIDPLIILGITSGATEQISNLSTGTIKVKRVENEQSLLMAYAYEYPCLWWCTWCHFMVCNSIEYFTLLPKFIKSTDWS